MRYFFFFLILVNLCLSFEVYVFLIHVCETFHFVLNLHMLVTWID